MIYNHRDVMDAATKKTIGIRLRQKREQANYTRERLGELCSLSPRFIANIELGDPACSQFCFLRLPGFRLAYVFC